MVLKLTGSDCRVDYVEFTNIFCSKYTQDIDQFWYFSIDGRPNSYSFGFNYKFKTKEDITKLVEDIYKNKFDGTNQIYDLDDNIKKLGITLGTTRVI